MSYVPPGPTGPPPGGPPPPPYPPAPFAAIPSPPPSGKGNGMLIAIGVVIAVLVAVLVAVVVAKANGGSDDNAVTAGSSTTAVATTPATTTTVPVTTTTVATTTVPVTTEPVTTEPATTQPTETCTTCTTDDESFLFRHMDAIHEKDCKIVEADQLSTARWDCQFDYKGVHIVAEYYKFSSFADLQTLVRQIRQGERTIVTEDDFKIDDIRIGTYIFSKDQDENVTWTDDANKVLGFAYSPMGTYDTLDDWWSNVGTGFTN